MKKQKNIIAGRDVAGRDIINLETTFVLEEPPTRLGGLIEQLKEQIGQDPEAAKFIESLLTWLTPKRTELKRDLTEKLTSCGKEHLIADALEAKELFSKQLKRTTFNPAVQEIYACVLGEVYTYFNYRIKPKISSAVNPGLIEEAVADLASYITGQMAAAPASLRLGQPEIIGMLFYLTGNCHLEWDYNASISPRN